MADLELQVGGGGGGRHQDREIREAPVSKKIFRPFEPQFGLKIRGDPGLLPGSGTTFQLTFTSDEGGSLTGVPLV